MKKLFALLLAVIMVISVAACAPAEPGTTTTAPKAEDPAKTTTAAKAETTTAAVSTPWTDLQNFDLTGIVEDNTVVVGIPSNATVVSYEDNALTQYMEELTGVEIEFVFFSSDGTEADQQLNLMIANQEKLPDVIFGIVDQTQATELGQQGLLCDITDFLNKSARVQAFSAAMTDFERDYFWARLPDGTTGEIYHVPTPNYMPTSVDLCSWMGALSYKMAENVGMKAEEIDTVDEVYEYLTKVINEDGNGNGQKDEIGFVWRDGGYRTNADLWIINAYIYVSDDYLYNVENGEVYLPYSTDEYRQAMITLNKWYKEGLISPLSFSIKDDAETKALVDVGPENYKVAAFGGHPTLITASDSVIGDYYCAVNTLQDETGKGGYANLRDPYNLLRNAVVPMNEEEPERMELGYLFCDVQYDYWVHVRWRKGVEGKNWEFVDGEAEGLKTNQGRWADHRYIHDTWSEETSDTWHSDPIYFGVTNGYDMGIAGSGTPFNFDSTMPPKRGFITYNNLWEKQEHEQPEEIIFSQVYNEEESEVITEYKQLYKDYMKQARAQLISGVIDPNDDAQWAQYLADLKANGEDELIEAAQGAYDRMNG